MAKADKKLINIDFPERFQRSHCNVAFSILNCETNISEGFYG